MDMAMNQSFNVPNRCVDENTVEEYRVFAKIHCYDDDVPTIHVMSESLDSYLQADRIRNFMKELYFKGTGKDDSLFEVQSRKRVWTPWVLS